MSNSVQAKPPRGRLSGPLQAKPYTQQAPLEQPVPAESDSETLTERQLAQAPAQDIPAQAATSTAAPLTESTPASSSAAAPAATGISNIPALLESVTAPVVHWGKTMEAWAQQINPDVFKPLLVFGGALVLVHQQSDPVAIVATQPGPVTPGPIDPGSSGGRAIDGYLSNALVWRDTNGNQTWDAGEPYTFTDANGAFSGLTNGTGTIRVTGLTNALRAVLTNEPSGPSTDISTGKVFEGVLSAPEGATVINPLTTLVVAVGTGPNAAATLQSLKDALGIDRNVDLANFDPLAAMASGGNAAAALAIQAASIQVASLMAMAVSTLQSGGSTLSVGAIVSSVATSLVSQAGSAGSGNLLTNSDVLRATLQSAAASSGISGDALIALNSTLAEASKALAQVNNAIQTTVANAGNNLNLADALGALTSVVAAQLVADDLTALVKAAAAPGATTVFNAESVDSFSAGLSAQIEAAKSSVKQLVVTPPNQALLVAVDDSLVVDKTPYQWPVKTGNLASNDLVGGGALQITSLSQGEHNSSTSGGEQVLQGSYGVLRVDSNGNYSYTVNRDVPVNANGTAHTEVFNYVAKNGSLTDTGKIVITLNNAVTHLALLSDMLTVVDTGHATAVQGIVLGSKISFNLAVHGAGLDSANLKNLLDGDDTTLGATPELQFDLQNLDALKLPQGQQTIGVTLDVQNSLIAGQHITAAFDAPIEFVRDVNGVRLLVPTGPITLHLSTAGIQLGNITVNNLDSDSFTLVEGIDAPPSLSIKLDHLLLKAAGNTFSLGTLNVSDLLPLAGGVLAGAFANKTVGDIVTLARELVSNITSVSDAHVATLIERLKTIADLPDAFAGITLNQSLHLAAELFNLPDMPNDFVLLANRVVGALGDSTLPQILHIIETTYPNAKLGGVLDALNKNISLPDSLSAMPVADLAHNLANLQAVASAFTALLGADGATVSSLITHVKTLIDTQGVNLAALNHLFDLSPLFGEGYSATDLVRDLSQDQIAADPLITLVSKAMLSSDSTVSVDLHLPTSLGLTSANGTGLQDIEVLLKVGTNVHTATAAVRDVNGNHQLDLSDLRDSDLAGLYISQPSTGQFTVNGTALTGLVGHVTQAQLSSLAFTAPAGQTAQSLSPVEVTLWAEDAQGALSGAQHVNLYLV